MGSAAWDESRESPACCSSCCKDTNTDTITDLCEVWRSCQLRSNQEREPLTVSRSTGMRDGPDSALLPVHFPQCSMRHAELHLNRPQLLFGATSQKCCSSPSSRDQASTHLRAAPHTFPAHLFHLSVVLGQLHQHSARAAAKAATAARQRVSLTPQLPRLGLAAHHQSKRACCVPVCNRAWLRCQPH